MITPAQREMIHACLAAGNTPSQIRRKLRVSYWVIRRVRKSAGLPPLKRGGMSDAMIQRQEVAMALRRGGLTLREIGPLLNPPVSGKRVFQILQGTGAKPTCAKCGKETMRLHYFHPECTPNGAEGICLECAKKIKPKL